MNIENALRKLDYRNNAEERLIRQVMELQTIKFNGMQKERIYKGDEICNTIDYLMGGFMWLYSNNLSMATTNVRDLLQNDLDRLLFEKIIEKFSEFNSFMAFNMDLKE